MPTRHRCGRHPLDNLVGSNVIADLLDEKFGRKEGFGIDEVLNGWAKQGMSDADLLERGVELIEALYHSISNR